MALHTRILGFVGVQPLQRRRPLRDMDFLHEESALLRAPDNAIRPRLQARDLFALLRRHFADRRRAAEPRCLIRLDVVTPAGRTAVKVLGACRLAAPAPDMEQMRARG